MLTGLDLRNENEPHAATAKNAWQADRKNLHPHAMHLRRVVERTGSSSHHQRPRPGRRRVSNLSKQEQSLCKNSTPARLLSSSNILLFLLLSLLLFCQTTTAERTHGDRRSSTVRRIARRGEILVDHSDPPTPRMHLEERQFEDLPESLSPTTTTRRSSQDDERPTTRPSSRTSVIAAQPTLTDTALPSPFDTNLGNNFTSPACPAFFNDFLKNSTFKSCLPISVLLRNSNSFFIATKNLVTITRTLDASCNADFRVCSALMEELGAKITDDAFCGSDFERENPMVIQAYEGFLAYQPLYQAACTRDVSGSYCFATAITNRSSISDSYPYYLPVGVAWPGGARPSCNECLKGIMRVFSDFASNKTQLIHETYQPAAQQMNIACGPEFINTTIPVKQNGSSDLHVSSSSLVTFVALLVTVFTLLL